MARRHHYRRHHYRRNPLDTGALVGDVEEAAWGAAGLAGTAVLSDRYLSPTLQKFNSGGNQMLGKVLDFGSALVTANVIGWLVGKVAHNGGKLARLGGIFYAGGKLLSVPFSDFQITASVPKFAGLPGGATATVALPAGSGAMTTGKAPAGASVSTTAGVAVSDPGQYVGF